MEQNPYTTQALHHSIIVCVLQTPKNHYNDPNRSPLDPILNQMNAVPTGFYPEPNECSPLLDPILNHMNAFNH